MFLCETFQICDAGPIEKETGSRPRCLRGNVCAWEAMGGAVCSLKPHAGALNKSAPDCFKKCTKFFEARGACSKSVREWKEDQHQLCIITEINSLNQGVYSECRESQMVLEHQLKEEDDQNAALELDLLLKPELIGIRPLNTLAANDDFFLTLQSPAVKSPGATTYKKKEKKDF